MASPATPSVLSYLADLPDPTRTPGRMPTRLASAAQRTDTANLAVYNAGGTPPPTSEHTAAGQAMLQPGYRTALDAPVAKSKFDVDNIDTVKDRINQIGNGIDPDAPAIFPNRRRRLELDQHFRELNGILDHNALLTAHQTHEDLINKAHTNAANEYVQWAKTYSAINSDREKYPLGSPERAQAIVGSIMQYPDGALTKAAKEILTIDGPRHDSHAALRNATAALTEPASHYFSPEALLKENPGAEYQQDRATGGYFVHLGGKAASKLSPDGVADKLLSADAKSRYDVPLADIRSPLAARSGNLDPATGVFTPANGGDHFQVDVLDKGKAGTLKTITIPRADYEKFGGKIGEADKVQGGKAAASKPAIVKQGGVTYHLQSDGSYK